MNQYKKYLYIKKLEYEDNPYEIRGIVSGKVYWRGDIDKELKLRMEHRYEKFEEMQKEIEFLQSHEMCVSCENYEYKKCVVEGKCCTKYFPYEAELVPMEKITRYDDFRESGGEFQEETWYEEIEEHCYANPYYAVVELEKGKRYPLPFFFESRTWELMGCCRDSQPGKFQHLKGKFAPWVLEWVDNCSTPNTDSVIEGIYHGRNEKREKVAIRLLPHGTAPGNPISLEDRVKDHAI